LARANAAQALAKLPGKAADSELLAAMKDTDPLVQLSAARTLAMHGNASGMPIAMSSLKRKEREFQLAAIDTLGWIKDRQALPVLEPLAQGKDPVIAQAAKKAIS